jgi:hypothetical protein
VEAPQWSEFNKKNSETLKVTFLDNTKYIHENGLKHTVLQ